MVERGAFAISESDKSERTSLRKIVATLGFCIAAAVPAFAGPPYVTDDPETTDFHHFEIYTFGSGVDTGHETEGAAGIDFNYGGGENLQLTAVLPIAYETAPGHSTVAGVGNIEIAAKYRFLRQDDFGWDVAVFPRVFLPSASSRVGDQHGSFLLPLWVEKDWGGWSTFGGGGCALNHGGGAKNYCLGGWALTYKLMPSLSVGAEYYHQSADQRGEKGTSGVGFGATYDLTENFHLMGSYGPGISGASGADRPSWYAAVLTTF